MCRPLVVSLLVHVALAAAAATVWHTGKAAPRNTVVLNVAPADDTPAPDPPHEPPPQPAAPSFDEDDIPFPEDVAVPEVALLTQAAPQPLTRALPRVVRLGCSLRPTPPPRPRVKPPLRPSPPRPRVKPPPRPANVQGPTHGPVLFRSDAHAPEYPRRARRMGHEGSVALLIHVAADGRVARVEVETSSGFASLDAAAVRAAQRWRFRPARANGSPVAATLRKTIRFRLQP